MVYGVVLIVNKREVLSQQVMLASSVDLAWGGNHH